MSIFKSKEVKECKFFEVIPFLKQEFDGFLIIGFVKILEDVLLNEGFIIFSKNN